jgi:hypothetical protein
MFFIVEAWKAYCLQRHKTMQKSSEISLLARTSKKSMQKSSEISLTEGVSEKKRDTQTHTRPLDTIYLLPLREKFTFLQHFF